MIHLIELERLKCHEKVIDSHLLKLTEEIKTDNMIKEAILVEKCHLVILDGHHRYNAAKMLGLKRIPAVLVDYREVTLAGRRENLQVTKESVIESAFSGRLFPPKTTKHIADVLAEANIKLTDLI